MHGYSAGEAAGFADPEAAHESRMNFYTQQTIVKLRKLLKYRVVRVYTTLVLLLLFAYGLREVLPSDLRQEHGASAHAMQLDLLDLSGHQASYTSFQHVIQYETILQSKELVARLNHDTRIKEVVHPSTDDITLEAIRFKKELNALKKEMLKTLHAQEFTCLPAIALGVPYNVFLGQNGTLYVNIIITDVRNLLENHTVLISSLFDKNGAEHEEVLFDEVVVEFTEANTFSVLTNKTLTGVDAYCLQSYRNNFAFSKPTQLGQVSEKEL